MKLLYTLFYQRCFAKILTKGLSDIHHQLDEKMSKYNKIQTLSEWLILKSVYRNTNTVGQKKKSEQQLTLK